MEIGRNRGVAVGMVGDVTSVLEQMTKEAANHVWKELPWVEELRAARAEQVEWAEKLARPATPMHALFVHKTLNSMLRPDDCLVFDGGDFCGRVHALSQSSKIFRRFGANIRDDWCAAIFQFR